MQDIVITVLGITGLLALVSLLPPLANRLTLPYTVLLAAVGCALGALVHAVRQVDGMGPFGDFMLALRGFGISSEAFLYIFLPTLLFEAALAIDVRRLMDDIAPVLLMAVIAVIVCTLVVGFALSTLAEVGLIACLLLGAIVATTDPVAVIGIFRDLGAPRRLCILVEGESLFNDAAAIALFALLLAMLLGTREADALGTAFAFLKGFAGGAAFGWLAARGACLLAAPLRGLRLAETTLTVSLAYLTFIVADRYLELSGVVAVVVAALVIGSYGRTRFTPSTWDSLVETWQQLGFWANSMVFLLAAMLVPRLLVDIGLEHALLLALLVLATLAARAVVLYGFLPLLSAGGLADRVSGPYKLVILWGGLRGAVSLALALAVAENMALPAEIRHFVAALATGFVLFTLFVQGVSLRPLLRLLQLDRLSPVERTVRDRALALSLAGIRERIEEVARSDQIELPLAREVTDQFAGRMQALEAEAAAAPLSEEERLRAGLATLASREQALYLQRFKERIISRRLAQWLLAQAGRLLDGVKTGGSAGYEAAAAAALAFPPAFRAALLLHRRLGFNRWLARQLADRFEMLLIGRLAVIRLLAFNDRKLAPLLGAAAGRRLRDILAARLQAIEQALAALRLQYPDYARILQKQYLARVALRLEGESYDGMRAEALVSQEIYNDLDRRLARAWHRIERQPILDIAPEREALVARVPLFAGLEESRLGEIARLLKPRLALPGERIIATGERGDAMYFIASGAVEVAVAPEPVRLGTGDFFGEIALLTNRPRTTDVTALGYCQLLVLYVRDFHRLLEQDPALRARIDAVARRRLAAAGEG